MEMPLPIHSFSPAPLHALVHSLVHPEALTHLRPFIPSAQHARTPSFERLWMTSPKSSPIQLFSLAPSPEFLRTTSPGHSDKCPHTPSPIHSAWCPRKIVQLDPLSQSFVLTPSHAFTRPAAPFSTFSPAQCFIPRVYLHFAKLQSSPS